MGYLEPGSLDSFTYMSENTTMKSTRNMTADDKRKSQRWEPMHITYLGQVRHVVQGGGGKLSPQAEDPGETRKTKPTG